MTVKVTLLHQRHAYVEFREQRAKELIRAYCDSAKFKGGLANIERTYWIPTADFQESVLFKDLEILTYAYNATNGTLQTGPAIDLRAAVVASRVKRKEQGKEPHHTALSVGDIVKIERNPSDVTYYLCCNIGFEDCQDIVNCSRITDSMNEDVKSVRIKEQEPKTDN